MTLLSPDLQHRMLYLGCAAIHAHGSTAQIDMAVEECAELIVALRHHVRGRASLTESATEIADVLIMCAQLACLTGPELVAHEVTKKLDRLEARLGERGKP